MIEALGIFFIVVVAFFVMGDLAFFGALWANRGEQEGPPPDSQDPINKVAKVISQIGGATGSVPSDGKVELNGVCWAARPVSANSVFAVGNKVRIASRDGLTLIVESTDDT